MPPEFIPFADRLWPVESAMQDSEQHAQQGDGNQRRRMRDLTKLMSVKEDVKKRQFCERTVDPGTGDPRFPDKVEADVIHKPEFAIRTLDRIAARPRLFWL